MYKNNFINFFVKYIAYILQKVYNISRGNYNICNCQLYNKQDRT
jgi:hypothetical protein